MQELPFSERMKWAGLYASVAAVLIYIVLNFDALKASYGLLPVLAVAIGSGMVITSTYKPLVERMRFTADQKKKERS